MTVLAACVASWLTMSLFAWITLGFSWLVSLSSALTIGVLYTAASASDARGWPLFRLLACLHGGIGVVNIQIESLVFAIAAPAAVIRDTAVGLLEVTAVSGLLAVAVTREWPRGVARSRGLTRWLWLRVPLVALSYVVLYVIAGALIYPFVRHFYMSTDAVTVPSFGLLAGTQVMRGLVYVAALIPLFRTMEGRRWRAAFVAGLSLSVLGGIAPLLLPVDDILPPDVRAVHMLEILGSNFLLGMIGAFLLVRRTSPQRSANAVVPA